MKIFWQIFLGPNRKILKNKLKWVLEKDWGQKIINTYSEIMAENQNVRYNTKLF
jgi:hypothetical protein